MAIPTSEGVRHKLRGVIASLCSTSETATISLKLKRKQGNCLHFVLPGEYVKWFENVYSQDGLSPDPDKCKIIKQWPQPKSKAEVRSFLQTAQFNAKFLAGKHGDILYPKLTKPLRDLTKKNVRLYWGQE